MLLGCCRHRTAFTSMSLSDFVPGEPTTPSGTRRLQSSRWLPRRWWGRISLMTERWNGEKAKCSVRRRMHAQPDQTSGMWHAPASWRQAASATGGGRWAWWRGRWSACGWILARTGSEAGPLPPRPQPESGQPGEKIRTGYKGYKDSSEHYFLVILGRGVMFKCVGNLIYHIGQNIHLRQSSELSHAFCAYLQACLKNSLRSKCLFSLITGPIGIHLSTVTQRVRQQELF